MLERDDMLRQITQVRQHTRALAAHLSAEDQMVQSMPDASPCKWHLGHTSWFFEAVVLGPHQPGYRPVDPRYFKLFNSYYESLGPRHPRPARGVLSRPSLSDVHQYRQAIDSALADFIVNASPSIWHVAAPLIELGLHHEQQHQELMLTDILHAFSLNPLWPSYKPEGASPLPADTALADTPVTQALAWHQHPGGLVQVGHAGASAYQGFAFDNETPVHPVWLQPFAIASDLVSNANYLDFVRDGGYSHPQWWLSDGWAQVQAQSWQAPLYWQLEGNTPVSEFGLGGMQAWQPDVPVRHLSFYEAAAFAQWAGARLPTEFEWEAAARQWAPDTQALQGGWFGQVWQWTRSSYDPYPGFQPLTGSVGEYNGKFMAGQQVLRGSSLATPPGHARLSYRNFFPPSARWQFSGLRLAKAL